MPSTLEQIGVNLPPIDPYSGGITTGKTSVMPATGMTPEGQPQGAQPVAEAQSPATLASAKDIADTIIAGAIIALEQVVSAYGVTSEQGKKILRAISSLEGIVPEEKVKDVQIQLSGMLSQPAGMTTGQPTGMTVGIPPVGGTPPAGGGTPPIV
jgi:hypothetical protein